MGTFLYVEIVDEAMNKCKCWDVPKHVELHREQGDVVLMWPSEGPPQRRNVHQIETRDT